MTTKTKERSVAVAYEDGVGSLFLISRGVAYDVTDMADDGTGWDDLAALSVGDTDQWSYPTFPADDDLLASVTMIAGIDVDGEGYRYRHESNMGLAAKAYFPK